MFKVQLKLIISASLLLSDFIFVYSEQLPGATTENVVVTLKNYFNSEQLAATLNRDNQSEPAKDTAQQNARANFARTARARSTASTKELFTCAISLDASCLIDHVEDIVDNANDNLLQQADAEARHMSVGRANSEEEPAPSTLIASIAQMMLDLPELLKDSLGGMFRSGQGLGEVEEDDNESDSEADEEEAEEDDEEAEDEDNEEEIEDDEEEPNDEDKNQVESAESKEIDEDGRKKCGKKKGCSNGLGGSNNGDSLGNNGGGIGSSADSIGGNGGSSGGNVGSNGEGGIGDFNDYGSLSRGTTSKEVGVARGKKKKKKKAIVKLLLLGLIIKAKITLLLKVLAAKLQIKFLLIAAANLLLNLARFWWDLKKGHGHEQPQKVIYYEHAQHQHHYDGGEDWQSSPGGSYWGRAYEDEETSEKSAHDIAYSKYIPKGTTYSRIDDKPNISWNPFG